MILTSSTQAIQFNIFSWQWIRNLKTLPNDLTQASFQWEKVKQSTAFLKSSEKDDIPLRL